MSLIDLFLDDEGKLERIPKHRITVCFDSDEDMNKWEKLQNDMNKYRWHDLRKNPKDLPESNAFLMVALDTECLQGDFKYYVEFADYRVNCGFLNLFSDAVIAWKYIEPFEEE